MLAELKIDPNETFPHLNRAPLVEAVVAVRARASGVWEEVAVLKYLKEMLPEYPNQQAQRQITQEIRLFDGASKLEDLGWTGLRCTSGDARNIAEFDRDGFSYHRLPPYEDWERFSEEALRLWKLFVEIARPAEIQRIGVRFIGRIEMAPQDGRFEDYIEPAPRAPKNMELPFVGFLHHDTFLVPGHPYALNLIQTIQPPQSPTGGLSIILDIDVGTVMPIPLDADKVLQCLREMRWLKNRAFFGSITPKVLEKYQ